MGTIVCFYKTKLITVIDFNEAVIFSSKAYFRNEYI